MIKINNENFNNNLVYPTKKAYALDESLNQAVLSLKNLSSELPFEPLSEVFLNGEEWLVARDLVNLNVYGDKKRYSHDLVVIEKTKLLEKYFVDSLNFKNPIVELDLNNKINAPYRYLTTNECVYYQTKYFVEHPGKSTYQARPNIRNMDKSVYKTPQQVGNNLNLKSMQEVGLSSGGVGHSYVIVLDNLDNLVVSYSGSNQMSNVPKITNAKKGNYKVIYLDRAHTGGATNNQYIDGIMFTISFLNEIKYAKGYTISDVVDRLLETVETIRFEDTPRFSLNSEQKQWLSTITAPEFVFAKMSLFEALKQVGGFIHAIPRLSGNEIYFDKLGERKYAKIVGKQVGYNSMQDIEQFCSEIDTNVSNLVNKSEDDFGTIVEPFAGGYKTMRNEIGIAKIVENDYIIETTLPIESIEKIELGYLSNGTKIGDITKFVYEEDEYSALSAYSAEFPYSRAYALKYKRGTRNIYGMQFEEQDAVHAVFKKPAIVNIIENKTGVSYDSTPYIKLQYNIIYSPIIEARLKQRKPNITATKTKAVLSYNQSASKVDARYFGENLKGVVARLGNIDKVLTYVCGKNEEIPKMGELFDKDYFISNVLVEEFYDYKKYSLTLSKDFNRWNEYVGIDKEQRFFEISKDYTKRFVVYEEELVITDNNVDSNDVIIKEPMLKVIKQNFIPTEDILTWYPFNRITCFEAETLNEDMESISKSVLPSVSSYFGNSAFYLFSFNSNFGSGNYVEAFLTDSKAVQKELPYGDEYGKAEYLNIKGLYQAKNIPSSSYSGAVSEGASVPNTTIGSVPKLFDTEDNPIVLKKNGGESIIFTYQIHNVTDKNNVVVGSGLAKKMAVRNVDFTNREYVDCYILDREVGNLEKEITDYLTTSESYDIDLIEKGLDFGTITPSKNGKSIVFIDRETKELVFAINDNIKIGVDYILPKMAFRRIIK